MMLTSILNRKELQCMELDHALSQKLCFSFYTINRQFNQLYQTVLSQFQLTYTQYLVLVLLWEHHELSLSELESQLGLASNTLTPLLKRLEAKDLLKRHHPATNRRLRLVTLTAAGKALQAPIEAELNDCFAQIKGLDVNTANELLQSNQALLALLAQQSPN